MEGSGSGQKGGAAPPSLMSSVLNNDVIIAKILELCPVSEVKKLRLVSRKWDRLARPVLRRLAVVSLIGSLPYRMRVSVSVGYPGAAWKDAMKQSGACSFTVGEFLESHQQQQHSDMEVEPGPGPGSETDVPFRNYSLKWWLIQEPGLEEDGEADRFWRECGGDITSLAISFCYFGSVAAFRQVVFGKMPNLRRLSLKGVALSEGEGERWREDGGGEMGKLGNLEYLEVTSRIFNGLHEQPFWKGLFSQCPKLKTLVVRNMEEMEMEGIFNGLDQAKSALGPQSLAIWRLDLLQKTPLTGEPLFSPQLFQKLARLHLPLRIITVNFPVTTQERKRLERMHAEKLEEFRVVETTSSSDTPEEIGEGYFGRGDLKTKRLIYTFIAVALLAALLPYYIIIYSR